MNRRRFLKSFAALPALAVAGSASAAGMCWSHGYNQVCEVGVDLRHFQFAAQPQFQSQWCWAACIAMLFAHHGRSVSQARIVSEVYGAPVNMPAMAGWVIARQLNRPWRDDHGRPFVARLGAAYDADAGHAGLNNHQILSELQAGCPLLMGAGGHAVVLTALRYVATPMGPQIVSGTAMDPWPGRGLRQLAPAELMPMHLGGALRFVATARVG